MTACAPNGYQAIQDIASQAVPDVVCKPQAFETKLWDGLKNYLMEQESIPTSEMLKSAIQEQVEQLRAKNPKLTQAESDRLNASFEKLIHSLLDEAPEGERVESSEDLLLLLSAIDVGDRSTEFRSYMQDKVRRQFKDLQASAQTLNVDCATAPSTDLPVEEPQDSAILGFEDPAAGMDTLQMTEVAAENKDYEYHRQKALESGVPLATFGGRWTLATAYQSCQTLQLPAMTHLTPDVQGISIVGKHSDGVGSKRSISSLSKVQSTHYYIKDSTSFGPGCFNVRQTPLIYDYGGKPQATTALTSPIDLFKNSGNGTSVLGIDCSGFIFTALATAGLRVKEGRPLKASDSWAWGSSSYVEPQKNGLTCLNKISVTPSANLKSGDIVAVYGHIFLIDKVGADPFGINNARSAGDCSKLKSSQFDFTVVQSSNSKNGIGLNFYEAKNYLATSQKMREGLEKYAYYSCLAKFNNKAYSPNVGTLSVVRHKGTKECMAPRVSMARESCVQSCESMSRD